MFIINTISENHWNDESVYIWKQLVQCYIWISISVAHISPRSQGTNMTCLGISALPILRCACSFVFYIVPPLFRHYSRSLSGSLRPPTQNGPQFADCIHFQIYFWNANFWISNEISLNYIPWALIGNMSALVQIIVSRRTIRKVIIWSNDGMFY